MHDKNFLSFKGKLVFTEGQNLQMIQLFGS